MMKGFEQAYAFDIHMRRDIDEKFPAEAIAVHASDIEEGVVYESDGVKVTAFNADHRPIQPALGYRIDYKGGSVAISGDTRKSDNLVKFSKGVDVLIHEVYGANPERRGGTPRAPELSWRTTRLPRRPARSLLRASRGWRFTLTSCRPQCPLPECRK